MKRILLIAALIGLAHWLSGQITTNTNFQVNSNNPIDNRTTIATLGDTSTITFPYEGLLVHVNNADVYYKYNGATWEIFDPGGGGGGAVSSVNSQTGAVVLDADDIDDTSTTNKFTSAAEISKLAGIESGATADQSDAEIETAYNNQVGIVSQAAAEAGSSTTPERWTPERVAQAITAQAALMTTSSNSNGGETVYRRTGTVTSNEINDIISGVLIPLQDNAKLSDTVSVPTGFTFTPAISIYRNGNNTFSTSIDDDAVFRGLYDVKGKNYYVDRIAGSDFNTGLSRNAPFSTYSFARSRSDSYRIIMQPGVYPGNTTFSTGRDSLSIVAGGAGEVVFGRIDAQATWTATSMTGVFKTAASDTTVLPMDLLNRGPLGEFVRMTKIVADTAGLASKPGKYTFVGGQIYVHTSDNETPVYNSNCFIVSTGSVSFNTASKVYLEGITFYGKVSFTKAGGNYYIQNCKFFDNLVDNLVSVEGANIVFKNCTFGHSVTDGIDYDTGATAIELNCKGRFFGRDVSGADNQASTAHGASQVVTINCDFGAASNESILDVNTGTQRWILGGRFGGHWNKETGSWFAIGVGNGAGDFAQTWIEGAKIGGDETYDLSANYGKLYVRNLIGLSSATRINLTNGGTIQKY